MNATAKGWRGKSRNKYGAKRTTLFGEHFDSQGEGLRWLLLRDDEAKGNIRDLKRQVHFPLYVFDWLIGEYVADFVYLRDGKRVVEDFKGHATDLFLWKARHFKAQYGQEIEVVR
jgi:hypothetical protein